MVTVPVIPLDFDFRFDFRFDLDLTSTPTNAAAHSSSGRTSLPAFRPAPPALSAGPPAGIALPEITLREIAPPEPIRHLLRHPARVSG